VAATMTSILVLDLTSSSCSTVAGQWFWGLSCSSEGAPALLLAPQGNQWQRGRLVAGWYHFSGWYVW
jgi:hypothetical protein